MTATSLNRIIALGAISGVRSMAGPATLAAAHDSLFKRALTIMAAGEMALDKTGFVGARTAPLPLTARAVVGGLVGGMSAQDEGDDVLVGGLVGAAAAVGAAHLAYHVRTRLALPSGLGGLFEDALVIGIAACCLPHRDDA
jgi:uncharacterized membrane protein